MPTWRNRIGLPAQQTSGGRTIHTDADQPTAFVVSVLGMGNEIKADSRKSIEARSAYMKILRYLLL